MAIINTIVKSEAGYALVSILHIPWIPGMDGWVDLEICPFEYLLNWICGRRLSRQKYVHNSDL
jgi:hypothetical protein